MNDATATAVSAPEKTPVRLADYRPPAFLVDRVELSFDLDPARTRVRSKLAMRRNPAAEAGAPLRLDGEKIELAGIALDGAPLAEGRYQVHDRALIIAEAPDAFILEIENFCAPEANTALSGLYVSKGMFCTQCEAEGFRRITYFPDRPDVLATFKVRIEADKGAYPVLLSNGNPGAAGDLDGGRHFAEWDDPHPKPCYLFALVGGDLAVVEDAFTTQSGKNVPLRIFVQEHNKAKCGFALDALKRSMKWDEEKYGREYDLDIFMIVAVDHFNMGAMENKGLNIFNSSVVLASPETATDMDYEFIEAVVAHEYFHNWSGNRVTCRDWFQLSLKEGFTVFRDQQFSADMRSAPVERIRQAKSLWARQFPEDKGPLAHPVRPESYVAIDNFYTATVYQKGAELVRMQHELLGPKAFRKGTDLYFERHDGAAVTIEDFVLAMEEASGEDLSQFRRWYSDAGTPQITVTETWDAEAGALTVALAQQTPPTPGQSEKPPRQIPVRVGVIGADGAAAAPERVLSLTKAEESFTIDGLKEKPLLSVLRGYSAPVDIHQTLSIDDRTRLIAADADPFNRWAVAHRLSLDIVRSYAGEARLDDADAAFDQYAESVRAVLADENLEHAFKAEVLRPPTRSDIARAVSVIDPGAIEAAHRRFVKGLAGVLEGELFALHGELASTAPYAPDATGAGRRALRNAALSILLLGGAEEAQTRASAQAATADNMTDEAAAVSALAFVGGAGADAALAAFYEKWRADDLVVNKWLGWQAAAPDHEGDSALARIDRLAAHDAYDDRNPNKVRALVGVFANENLAAFHAETGAGYDWFAETVSRLDAINPNIAARLTTALSAWRDLEPGRRARVEEMLGRLSGAELSAEASEMVTRLAAPAAS